MVVPISGIIAGPHAVMGYSIRPLGHLGGFLLLKKSRPLPGIDELRWPSRRMPAMMLALAAQ